MHLWRGALQDKFIPWFEGPCDKKSGISNDFPIHVAPVASIKTIKEAILQNQAGRAQSLLPSPEEEEASALRFCRLCIAHELQRNGETFQALEGFDVAELESPDLLVHMVRSMGLRRSMASPDSPESTLQFKETQLAIKLLERAVDLGPEDEYVRKVAFELTDRLSWYQEACDHLQSLIRLKPDDESLLLRGARYYLAHGDAQGALDLLETVKENETKSPQWWFLYAQLLIQAGQEKQALEAIEAGLQSSPSNWQEALHMLVNIGAIERAEEVAIQAPPQADRAAALARFSLWKLDLPSARSHVDVALKEDPQHLLGLLVHGALLFLENEYEQALVILEDVERRLPPQQGGDNQWLSLDAVMTWQSEIHRQAGHHEKALRAADRAKSSGHNFGLLAYLNRLLALTHLAQSQGNQVMSPDVWRPVLSKVADLLPTNALENLHTPHEVQALSQTALSLFGGNRSSRPTLLTAGKLNPFETPPHPRQLGRMLQHLLRTQSTDHVLHLFEKHHARFPDDATTLTYWGETLLWLGDYEEAAQRFREAISLHRPTTWAWIGLGATMLLQEDFQSARSTWEEGVKAARFRGPTLYVYEGEMLRKVGDLDAAKTHLDHALRTKPERISAWINRALLSHLMGNKDPLVNLAKWIQRESPGMWIDLCARAKGSPSSLTDLPNRFELLLDMMRGNRSSALASYLVDDNTLRFGRWKPPQPNQIMF